MKISDQFTIAAAFGNVHGVYKPGNVKLQQSSSKILRNLFRKNLIQKQIQLILFFMAEVVQH